MKVSDWAKRGVQSKQRAVWEGKMAQIALLA